MSPEEARAHLAWRAREGTSDHPPDRLAFEPLPRGKFDLRCDACGLVVRFWPDGRITGRGAGGVCRPERRAQNLSKEGPE